MKFRSQKDRSREKKQNNQWEDHYTRKARKEDYPARSVYKLQEIQKKFTLIRKNDSILDLGCYPGSWLLYAAELAGPGGKVHGIDLNETTISLPPQARAIKGNILEPEEDVSDILKQSYNVILSDMAPATTGIKDTDAFRSFELCSMALEVAGTALVKGGFFVCKIFQGKEFESFIGNTQKIFEKHRLFKPESCRKQSKEIYIIGLGKK